MNPSPWSRRAVAAGVVALLAGFGLACGGATASGLLLVAVGALGIAFGSRRGLEAARASGAAPDAPSAGAVAQRAAISADLLLAATWEATTLVRRVPDLPRAAADVENALARWRERGLLDRPERAHPLPPPLEKPRLTPIRVAAAGDVEHLSFASEFDAVEPEIAAAYHASVANRTAHALLLRHRGGAPRPTLIALHGFGMGRPQLDLAWLRLRGLDLAALHRELGIDVAYVILPFHGPRTSAGMSGSGFFDTHPLAAAAALGQAVWDVRRIAGWLRAQGAPALGVHGLSLGGCVAALHASLDASLAYAVPMIPAVDLAAIFWQQLPVARRREWAQAGLDRARLAEAWSLQSPLRLRPRAPHGARLIVAGALDQVTPAAGARALWSHWDEPALHWLPGGHLAWLGGDALQRRLREHLRATLLAAQPPSAPPLSRFRASPPPPAAAS